MRHHLLCALVFALAACASSEPDAATDSANLEETGRVQSTSRTKTLATPLALPTDSDIGKTVDAVFAAKSAGFTEIGRSTYEGQGDDGEKLPELTVRYRSSANPSLTLVRRTSPTVPTADGRSFYRGIDVLTLFTDDERTELWADHPDDTGKLDGKVDSYSHEASGRSYSDENHDGRLDWWAESVDKLPGFVIEGYGDCIAPSPAAKRILEDLDFNGSFETESVTAKTDGTWWDCAK